MATMVSIYKIIIAVEACVLFAHGFSIVLNDQNSVKLSELDNSGYSRDHTFYQTSVHHFARHGLCGSHAAQRHFYQALKTQLCNMKWQFIANFVKDLCREKHFILDRWASELFDIDGNGFISHYEKHLYRYDD